MPETKTLIPDELKHRVEDLARDQNRELAEVVEEAVTKVRSPGLTIKTS